MGTELELPMIYLAFAEVRRTLNYEFDDKEILMEALEPAGGATRIETRHTPDGNKRLAVVNAAAIKAAASSRLYANGASLAEMRTFLARVSSKAYWADIGFRKKFDGYVTTFSEKIKVLDNVMACTMEGMLGAVMENCGGDIALR